MRKKKTYITILIILIIYFLVLFLVWGKNNLKEEKYATTIMVGDNTIWTYEDKKWLKVTKRSSIENYNWQKFRVFVDNNDLGEEYLWHDDKWYIFDEKRQAIENNGKFMAYKSNRPIDVLAFKEGVIEDYTYVNEVLVSNNLSINSKFTLNSVVSLDLDNDGVDEDFYLISNAFSDEVVDVLFSIVFMVKNEEIYYIYKDIFKNDFNYNECKPYFNYFLDINHDKKYEFILSCGKYSIKEGIDMLYEFKDNKFNIIISNQ